MASNSDSIAKLTYTVAEFCKASGMGRTTVFSHIRAGRLKTRMVGGLRMIPAESAREFLLGDAA